MTPEALLAKVISSRKHKDENKIKSLMAKGMTYEDAYNSVFGKTGKQYMLHARAMRKNEFIQPKGYKFTPQGTLVKKANLEGEKIMKFTYREEQAVEKTAEAKMDKKKKKVIDFGMLSVKAGIDSNPKATKADKIVGAKMNKKAYAKDTFTPHMMYHGKKSKMAKTYAEHMSLKGKGWAMLKTAYAKDTFTPHMMYHGKKSKMAKTYAEHMSLKGKGWGHVKTAATALTKSVLKHLKSGKGIKDTAKKLKVDEDLVVETARKNIQSKTTAKAITKETNKGMLAKVMDAAAGRKPVTELKAHAKASGGESKRVVKNMLGKKQLLGQRGSFKNLPEPTPKVKAEIVAAPKAMAAFKSKTPAKAIDVSEVAPSMLDRAKKYLKGNAGLVAGGMAAGGTGGYVMGKNASYDPTSTKAGADENSEFIINKNVKTGEAIDRLVQEWINRKVSGVRKESPVVIVKEIDNGL